MRQVFICLISFSILFLAWIITVYPDKNLHFVFCDVGQGDAILVQQGFKQLLIDTGPGDQVLSCLQEFMPKWDRSVEVLLLTHDDFDHIGGLESLLSSYSVKQILVEKSSKFLNEFSRIENELNKELFSERVKQPFFGTKICLSDMFCGQIISHFEPKNMLFNGQKIAFSETILSDADSENSQTEVESNDRSIVLLFHAKNKEFLLMGDLGEEGELALVNDNLINKINLLKVGHHGSKTSSDWFFLLNTQPEIAVISCGKNNKFGHPDSTTLEKLNQIGAKTFRTDELGSLEFVTNGEKIWQLF